MANEFTPPQYTSPFILGTSVTAVSTGNSFTPPQPQETFEQRLEKNVRQFDVTLDLPPEIHQWIASIVTYWAVVEWIQIGTLSRLLYIERKEARVMFGARIGNSAPKIRQLIEMRNITVPTDMNRLAKLLTESEQARNLVGHGVWMIDPETNELCIENPAGEWNPPKEPAISRRKYPQAFRPTQAWLVQTLDGIKACIRDLQDLDLEIDAWLPASTRKSG